MPSPQSDMVKVPTPASPHVGTQASLEPLDRLNLANKSRNIGRKVIEAARSTRSVDYHVKFISERKVRQLVDRDAVFLELKRSRKGPLTTQEPWKLCKILTILYLMGRPTKLRLFVSKSVNDMHLPFSGVRDSDNTTALRSTKDPHAPWIIFENRADAENFLRHQWAVLPHVFRPQQDEPIPHYTIEDEVILPFRGQNLTARQGASGKVFWTSIDPDHHHWDWNKVKSGVNSNAFAVKTLHSKDQLNFNREVELLRSMNNESHHHPHIVPLLASYEQKGTFNLIFPWADMDLFAYWETHVHPVQDARTARWVAEQCRGLAEALSQIHTWQTISGSSVVWEEEQEGIYRTNDTKNLLKSDEKAVDSISKSHLSMHGRVKPENILWYPGSSAGDLGILKITDFGMATLSRDYSRPGVMPVSPTYRSPEYDLHATQSPACDVWALGCTCLEFVTWFYGGHEKLHDSAMGRLENDEKLAGIMSDKFFAIYYLPGEPTVKREKVKDSVVKLYQELLEHPTSVDSNLSELIVAIRDTMIVVHAPRFPEYSSEHDPLSQKISKSSELGQPRRKSSEQVAGYLGSLSILSYDVVDLSRHYTRESNASSARPSTMTSIPDVLGTGASSLRSYMDSD